MQSEARAERLPEGNQLAIYKSDRGCTLGTTESNKSPKYVQSGTLTKDLRTASPTRWPLSDAASYRYWTVYCEINRLIACIAAGSWPLLGCQRLSYDTIMV